MCVISRLIIFKTTQRASEKDETCCVSCAPVAYPPRGEKRYKEEQKQREEKERERTAVRL